MATEEDKTNTGVAGTAIAVGVAAMIAGSAALVGMARAEMDDFSNQTQGYADLTSIQALKGEHIQKLSAAKVSIEKARAATLLALKRDPDQASPWTPKPPPPEASASSTETGAAASGETSEAAPETSGTTAETSASAVDVTAAPTGEAAPDTSAAPASASEAAPESPKPPALKKKKKPAVPSGTK